MPRRFSAATLAFVLAFALGACTGDDGGSAASASPPRTSRVTSPAVVTPVETTETPQPSPTEPPVPDVVPKTRGATAPDCVDGWVTPPRNSPRYLSPIGIIRRATGVRGPLEIVDMRYFEGPESPPSDKGYLLLIQRWYVKLFARKDYSFAGRFLVEARRFGQGLSAVAPYDSTGFESPDWIGFQLSADTTPKAYPGLPAEWAGIPYDFVKGGEGLTIPGLPDEVTGCLDGT
jgi:hypothetical protein